MDSPKVLSRIFLPSQVNEVLELDTLLRVEPCDTSCSILFSPQTLYNYLSLKMETHWASFFKRSINIYINSLYLLKAKSLKFSIDILNHKNIFLLYYINLNAILNHKNKLLLFFYGKKVAIPYSIFTCYSFISFFLFLFVSFFFEILLSLFLFIWLYLYLWKLATTRKKKFSMITSNHHPHNPSPPQTHNPPSPPPSKPTNKDSKFIPKPKQIHHSQSQLLKPILKPNKINNLQQKKPTIHNLSHNQNKSTISRIGFISTTLNFNSKPTLISTNKLANDPCHRKSIKPLHHTWFAKRENKAFYKRERERELNKKSFNFCICDFTFLLV